jgi:hypothetical protein
MGHMYIYNIFLKMADTITFPPGTPCITRNILNYISYHEHYFCMICENMGLRKVPIQLHVNWSLLGQNKIKFIKQRVAL